MECGQWQDVHMKIETRLELCCHKPKKARRHRKLEEARKDISLVPSEEM
jgi:hypothetical protein